jgi:uncharacterized protein (TIGR04255 family)
MARVLTFPDAPHVQFPNAPLKLMLGQVRFPAVLKAATPGGLAGLQEELGDEYSDFAEEQQFGLIVGPGGMQPTNEARNYRFRTKDGAWSVLVNPTSVTLEASIATKYSTYEEFNARYSHIWDVVIRQLKPARLEQQGLRYVDFFDWPDVKPADWRRYLAPALLGALGVDELVDHLEHTITDARLQLGDLGVMSLKYGLARGGPEQVVGFLIDTDVFRQASEDDVSVETVMTRFTSFHEEIHAFFNWATTPDARGRFNRE